MTIEQFRAANQKKIGLDQASAELMERQKQLQVQIDDFEGGKGKIQVCANLYCKALSCLNEIFERHKLRSSRLHV